MAIAFKIFYVPKTFFALSVLSSLKAVFVENDFPLSMGVGTVLWRKIISSA